MRLQTYYDILDVSPRASDLEVRVAYRRLALRWHPDRNPEDSARATEMLAQVNRAYSLVQTRAQREIYNSHLVHYIRERRVPSRHTAIQTNKMMRRIASARLAAFFSDMRRAVHG